MFLVDLHSHSHLSRDCRLDPKQVVARAHALGLDGIAFTETNTLDGCDELLQLQPTTPVRIFAGLELWTDLGPFLIFVDDPTRVPEPVQVWGSNREKPWSAQECLPRFRKMGAAIVATRPYDRSMEYVGGDKLRAVAELDAIGVYHPRIAPQENDRGLELALSMRLAGVSGSDARSSLDEVGHAATAFDRDIRTQAELVAALRSKKCWPVVLGNKARTVEAKSFGAPPGHNKRRRRGPRSSTR